MKTAIKPSMTTTVATQKQLEALKRLGWRLCIFSFVDVHDGAYFSNLQNPLSWDLHSLKDVCGYSLAKDWAHEIAREQQTKVCTLWHELGYYNRDQMSWQHEDSRIRYEQRTVEYGVHTRALGPADIQPELSAGLNICIIEMIVAARLCDNLGIGADGKRIKKAA